MPTLIERARNRLAGALLGEEKQKLEESLRLMAAAYYEGPWAMPPAEVIRQLQELDPWLLQDYLNQLGWDVIGFGSQDAAERERAVRESRRLYKYSPMAQWAIWLWTSWGLGESVAITLDDEKANAIFQEFWTADRNQAVLAPDVLQELSDWLNVDGNEFLSFYASTVDGEPTIGEIDPDEITEIVTMPGNSKRPVFYKREWVDEKEGMKTWYYPDWTPFLSGALDEEYKSTKKTLAETVLPKGAYRADTGTHVGDGDATLGDEEVPSTVVCLLHLHHNHKERGSLWGWPLLTTSTSWLKAHKRFMESRLAIVEGKAQFITRYTVASGSRGVKAMAATMASNLSQATAAYDTNPPAAPGSSQFVNKAVDADDLPMTTGAGDATSDNNMFAWHGLLGTGLFPPSAGLDVMRYATALSMDRTQVIMFTQYKTFWSSAFKKIVKIVMGMRAKYGGAKFPEYKVDVSVDSFSLADFPDIAKALGALVQDMLTPLEADGTIPVEAARNIASELWRIVLQSLGIANASELTSEEAFAPPEEEAVEEPPPEEEPPAPVAEEPEEEAPPVGTVEAIAEMIVQNARDGTVDWEPVAESLIGMMVDE